MSDWHNILRNGIQLASVAGAQSGVADPEAPLDLPATLPSLPRLPHLPSLPMLGSLPTAKLTQALGTPIRDVPGSYADEVEDLSIACIPCTRSHLSTMAMAAEEGVRLVDSDDRGARVHWARVIGEGLVMEALDWTGDKLARARLEDRLTIEDLRPQLKALMAQTPSAPEQAVLAWAAVDESLRFARSPRATDRDRQQVQLRMRLAEDLMNYSERMILTPDGLTSHLARIPMGQHDEAKAASSLMREARHRLVSSNHELAALEFIAGRLGQAVVALTPPVDRVRGADLAQRYRQLRVDFDRRVMAIMRRRNQG